jgi:hypothetical protein
MFSRTKACPIASQRLNPLAGARIGGNYLLRFQKININDKGVFFSLVKDESLSSRLPQLNSSVISDI